VGFDETNQLYEIVCFKYPTRGDLFTLNEDNNFWMVEDHELPTILVPPKIVPKGVRAFYRFPEMPKK